MDTKKKILDRLEQLINIGEQVLISKREYSYGEWISDTELASQWLTSSLTFLERVFGENSAHAIQVKSILGKNDVSRYDYALIVQGVLKSAKDDIEQDALFELKALIEAEVFDDFLEQAEHLIQAGYHQPAAVIIGCVLEDGLRKLCIKHEIELPDKPKLDWMNNELAKKGAYNKLVQKSITAYADLRNKAAHGRWDEFTKDDVDRFLDWTKDFMSRYFT